MKIILIAIWPFTLLPLSISNSSQKWLNTIDSQIVSAFPGIPQVPISISDTSRKDIHDCPSCKSNDQIIPVVYGKPTRETVYSASKGLLMLGGCMISEPSPRWYCKKEKLFY